MIKPPFFQSNNARPINFRPEYRSLQADGLASWWCPSIANYGYGGVGGTGWNITDEFPRWAVATGSTASEWSSSNAEHVDLISANELGGLCVNFDGANESMNLGTSLRQQGEMSVCAWIRPTSVAAATRTIVADAGSSTAFDYALVVNINAGKWRFHQADVSNGTDATTSLTVNVWQHLAAVRTGSSGDWTITYYYNGVADGTYAETADPDSSASACRIGRLGNLNANYFAGDIADVRVYGRALSASDIAHQYDPPTRWDLYRALDSGTPALWKLGQGAHIFYPAIPYPQIHQKLMVV